MKVRCRSEMPLLLFINASEPDGGGAYRVDPGEEFDVPDGTQLPPGIECVDADAEECPATGEGEACQRS